MKKHVLIVDDEPDFLELIAHCLQANGFESSSARDGMEGLDKARRLRPDAVILDVMLPDLDGFTICEMLRNSKATCRIPVLMLTCLGGTLSRCNGIYSGANEYLTKPFKIPILIERLRAVTGHEVDLDSDEGPT